MNRYNYTNSIEYKKYCIKELLKIKKLNLLKEIYDRLYILKKLFDYKKEINEYYNLDITLTKYMPNFYANKIYDHIKYKSTYKITELPISTLTNLLFYTNKAINKINKQIDDLYYDLI